MKPFKNVNRLKSEKGFTMLEMLFAFSIFCLTSSFLPLLFGLIFHEHSIESRIQKLEWELFLSQLKIEIHASEDVKVVNNVLVLTNGELSVSYQQYNNQIRRRVDKKGHEIVLQNVASVFFLERDRGVVIKVEDQYNHDYLATVYPFIRVGITDE